MTQLIKYPANNFDDGAKFTVAAKRGVPMDCYLFCAAWHEEFTGDAGYNECYSEEQRRDHAKVFCLQSAGVIKSHYTEQDIANRNRLNAMVPLKDGDIVEIEGKGQYRFKLYGDYSNAGEFIKV